jgi:hypothetical protein
MIEDSGDGEIAESAEVSLNESKTLTMTQGESQRIHVTDSDCVGSKGVTTGKVVQAFEEAVARRAWLYEEWTKHFDAMGPADKFMYEVPEPYELPRDVVKPSFMTQLDHQVRRGFIVAWRNRFSKVIDVSIIVVAVIIITVLDGVAVVSLDKDPDMPFEVMTRPDLEEDGELINLQLFGYALTRQNT